MALRTRSCLVELGDVGVAQGGASTSRSRANRAVIGGPEKFGVRQFQGHLTFRTRHRPWRRATPSPMPPAPMRATKTYGPIRSPGAKSSAAKIVSRRNEAVSAFVGPRQDALEKRHQTRIVAVQFGKPGRQLGTAEPRARDREGRRNAASLPADREGPMSACVWLQHGAQQGGGLEPVAAQCPVRHAKGGSDLGLGKTAEIPHLHHPCEPWLQCRQFLQRLVDPQGCILGGRQPPR